MPRLTTTERVLGGIFIVLLALLLSVLECFYVNARAGTTPVPLVQILTPLVNAALPWAMSRLTGQPRVCPAPAVVWVIVALVFASSGPAGDVVVPGNWQGQVFLLLGMLGAALGVFWVFVRDLGLGGFRRGPAAARRDAARTAPR
ncbi:MAG TPA: hypothetical protein VHC49_17585 [Mycobacteriales bacterium]|nr:hypothetical protein [Mycobacteriales bacterium]